MPPSSRTCSRERRTTSTLCSDREVGAARRSMRRRLDLPSDRTNEARQLDRDKAYGCDPPSGGSPVEYGGGNGHEHTVSFAKMVHRSTSPRNAPWFKLTTVRMRPVTARLSVTHYSRQGFR